MIDTTNVGISPLLSQPVGTSFATTPGLTAGALAQPATLATAQPTTLTTGSLPLMSTGAVLDQGLTLPPTTTSVLPNATASLMTPTLLPDAGLGASFVPQTTLPDQALTSFAQTPNVLATPAAVPSVVSPSVVAPTLPSIAPSTASLAVPGVGLTVGGVQGSALPSLASPELVSSNPLAQTTGAYATSSTVGGMVSPSIPQNLPVGLIMDEDFQRGRPIYDELSEDRYRGFRLGR